MQMIKTKNKPDWNKRSDAQGMRIAERLPQLMKYALGDSQTQLAELISVWPEIMGAELAPYCYPAKWQAGRDMQPTTLTLAVKSGFAPIVQMQSPQISAAIRSKLGIPVINLRFVQV